MQNQKLEQLIQSLKTDQVQKPGPTIKRLRPVLKAFNEYSTTADTLPPPTLIPICLFVLPKLFRSLLGLQDGEVLQEQPQKSGVRLCLHLYLKGLLRLLGQSDEQIKHIVVQSMVQNMQLVRAYPQICRKWVRALVQIWASNTQNLDLGLRCFMALQKALRSAKDEFYIWGLRRMYVGYFQNCGQVTWRTLEHINFMGNCFCEVLRLNPAKSYYVLFGYIRTIAMQIQSLNNCRGKQKQQITSKLYSMQILQALRLLGQVVGKSGAQELSGLTYPLAELISAYERISQSPQYLTLKLHVVKVQLELMENTGLYLPHVLQALLKILRCGPLNKKHARKAEIQGSIELGYKLSHLQLKNTNVLNDIFDKTLFYVYWLVNLSFKTLGGVELAKHISRLIQGVELGFVGHRKSIKAAAKIFLRDAEKVEQARLKRKLALGDKASQKFQNNVLSQSKIKLESHQTYLNILEERQSLFKAKVLAEQEDNMEHNNRYSDNEDELEDQEQLESGWEEASEGASELDEREIKSKDSEYNPEEIQDISYSGDPEDVSEAIKEWSEHQWSSQEQVQV